MSTPEVGQPKPRVAALIACALSAILVVGGCGSGQSGGTPAGQDSATLSGYASGDACEVLTARVAAEALAGHTHVNRANSRTRGASSNCERESDEVVSNFIGFGKAQAGEIVRGNPKIDSVKAYMEDVRKTLGRSCRGVGVLSNPTRLSSDAVQCVVNPDTNAERAELVWTHPGFVYTLLINLGGGTDNPAPAETDRVTTALREMGLLAE